MLHRISTLPLECFTVKSLFSVYIYIYFARWVLYFMQFSKQIEKRGKKLNFTRGENQRTADCCMEWKKLLYYVQFSK